MPILEISSLPPDGHGSQRERSLRVARQFALCADVQLDNVSVIWHLLDPGSYVVAGQVVTAHSPSAPVQAVLIAPDFHKPGRRQKWLYAAAQTLSDCMDLPRSAIFCHYRPLASGEVYDGGNIVTW